MIRSFAFSPNSVKAATKQKQQKHVFDDLQSNEMYIEQADTPVQDQTTPLTQTALPFGTPEAAAKPGSH